MVRDRHRLSAGELAESADRKAEEDTSGNQLSGASSSNSGLDHRPWIAGADIQLEPRGDGIDVVRPGQRHGYPPVCRHQQPGGTSATRATLPTEVGQRGSLTQQRWSVDHDLAAELTRRRGKASGPVVGCLEDASRHAEAWCIRSTREPHDTAVLPTAVTSRVRSAAPMPRGHVAPEVTGSPIGYVRRESRSSVRACPTMRARPHGGLQCERRSPSVVTRRRAPTRVGRPWLG